MSDISRIYSFINKEIVKNGDFKTAFDGNHDGVILKQEYTDVMYANESKWDGEKSQYRDLVDDFWAKFDTKTDGNIKGTNFHNYNALSSTEINRAEKLIAVLAKVGEAFEKKFQDTLGGIAQNYSFLSSEMLEIITSDNSINSIDPNDTQAINKLIDENFNKAFVTVIKNHAVDLGKAYNGGEEYNTKGMLASFQEQYGIDVLKEKDLLNNIQTAIANCVLTQSENGFDYQGLIDKITETVGKVICDYITKTIDNINNSNNTDEMTDTALKIRLEEVKKEFTKDIQNLKNKGYDIESIINDKIEELINSGKDVEEIKKLVEEFIKTIRNHSQIDVPVVKKFPAVDGESPFGKDLPKGKVVTDKTISSLDAVEDKIYSGVKAKLGENYANALDQIENTAAYKNIVIEAAKLVFEGKSQEDIVNKIVNDIVANKNTLWKNKPMGGFTPKTFDPNRGGSDTKFMTEEDINNIEIYGGNVERSTFDSAKTEFKKEINNIFETLRTSLATAGFDETILNSIIGQLKNDCMNFVDNTKEITQTYGNTTQTDSLGLCTYSSVLTKTGSYETNGGTHATYSVTGHKFMLNADSLKTYILEQYNMKYAETSGTEHTSFVTAGSVKPLEDYGISGSISEILASQSVSGIQLCDWSRDLETAKTNAKTKISNIITALGQTLKDNHFNKDKIDWAVTTCINYYTASIGQIYDTNLGNESIGNKNVSVQQYTYYDKDGKKCYADGFEVFGYYKTKKTKHCDIINGQGMKEQTSGTGLRLEVAYEGEGSQYIIGVNAKALLLKFQSFLV